MIGLLVGETRKGADGVVVEGGVTHVGETELHRVKGGRCSRLSALACDSGVDEPVGVCGERIERVTGGAVRVGVMTPVCADLDRVSSGRPGEIVDQVVERDRCGTAASGGFRQVETTEADVVAVPGPGGGIALIDEAVPQVVDLGVGNAHV